MQACFGSERSGVDKDKVVVEFGKGLGAAQDWIPGSRPMGPVAGDGLPGHEGKPDADVCSRLATLLVVCLDRIHC